MMDVLSYIKKIFHFPDFGRKRRVEEINDFESYSCSKYRRITSPPRQMDDIAISPGVIRRPVRHLRNIGQPKEIIILDDDTTKNDRKKKFTSTPLENRPKELSFQEDDDIKFVREFKASDGARKQQLLKPFSIFQSLMPMRQIENSNSINERPVARCFSNENTFKRPHLMQLYTNRLDDKKEYQNLLESTLSNGSSVASEYFTPNSRLSKYDFSDRTKKILNLSRERSKGSVIPAIDLTEDESNGNSSSSRLSVRDKIRKVLSHETVEIPDSDTDIEILPSPPSPKPDIIVEPVNSLKKIVATSHVCNKKWLADILTVHRQKIEERSRDLKYLEESSKKLNAINRDIRVGTLSRKIDKCLQIKDAVLPIEEDEPELPQLTSEQYAIIDRAFKGSPHEVLVKKFNLNITRKDILTLAGLNWLNDEVINFYMNLIIERAQLNENYPKVHCFNTFFYPKLLKDGPESLRRWTRRIDIFTMDIICVPIHLGVHWCMSIIDIRNRSIKYYDSMGSANQKCLYALKNYLESEHMDKKKSSYDTSDFNLESVRDIPQQMNGSDCGMFSCTFAEFYSRDAKFTFKQEDMPYLRSKMVVEIITGGLLIK